MILAGRRIAQGNARQRAPQSPHLVFPFSFSSRIISHFINEIQAA
jgi:hypothetical protein